MLAAAAAWFSAAALAAGLGPTERVRLGVDGVIEVLRDASLERDTRWERIGRIIDRHFDFQSMSQSVLATNWQYASREEKRRFVEFFSQYIETTFRAQIESYTDERIEYIGERINRDRAVVDTVLVSGAKRIPISYRLRKDRDEWRAYDVVIEGVSLVRNYRDTFAAIVKSEGMEGLLTDVQRRIDRYRAERGAVPRD